MGINKRIIIVASPNVQDNFKLQLFDERKLKEVDGIWTVEICTYPNWRDDVYYQAFLQPIVLRNGVLYKAISSSTNVDPDTIRPFFATNSLAIYFFLSLSRTII
jgi:hypothetical protein